MPTTIKYIGTADNYAELAITGKQSVWQVGQQEERTDAEAALLLSTGMFSTPSKPVTATTNLTGGIIKTIWTGSQAQYDAIPVKDDNTLYVIVG